MKDTINVKCDQILHLIVLGLQVLDPFCMSRFSLTGHSKLICLPLLNNLSYPSVRKVIQFDL